MKTTTTHPRACLFLLALLLMLGAETTRAGSATWKLDPVSNDWNTAANWLPNTVPTDLATFDTSNTNNISISAETAVGSILFTPGASEFSITTDPAVNQSYLKLTINGAGITNISGVPQNFVAGVDAAGNDSSVEFIGSATTTGSLTNFTTEANPTASSAYGGYTGFLDSSSAGDSAFYNSGAALEGAFGGVTIFYDNATAGNGTFVNGGGVASGANGGVTWFTGFSDASNAVITSNAGAVSGALGGVTEFEGHTHGSDATLIANGGVDGAAGGSIRFDGYKGTSGNRERVQLFGNGNLDIGGASNAGVSIGSLEGDGLVFLSTGKLTVGSNDLSTSFSGVIQGSGTGASLSKLGKGTLTLSGASTYTGRTTIYGGGLVVDNLTGSGTGAGPVQVNAGALGGIGSIDGAVTIGTGNGAGAFLAPSKGESKLATLTILSTLTCKADSTYRYSLNCKKAKADEVIANGVTIESGALFSFLGLASRALAPGTVFTAISNTAATPIAGAFANLSDSSMFTDGRNTFQASYEGGDGNDLTLTVVP